MNTMLQYLKSFRRYILLSFLLTCIMLGASACAPEDDSNKSSTDVTSTGPEETDVPNPDAGVPPQALSRSSDRIQKIQQSFLSDNRNNRLSTVLQSLGNRSEVLYDDDGNFIDDSELYDEAFSFEAEFDDEFDEFDDFEEFYDEDEDFWEYKDREGTTYKESLNSDGSYTQVLTYLDGESITTTYFDDGSFTEKQHIDDDEILQIESNGKFSETESIYEISYTEIITYQDGSTEQLTVKTIETDELETETITYDDGSVEVISVSYDPATDTVINKGTYKLADGTIESSFEIKEFSNGRISITDSFELEGTTVTLSLELNTDETGFGEIKDGETIYNLVINSDGSIVVTDNSGNQYTLRTFEY